MRSARLFLLAAASVAVLTAAALQRVVAAEPCEVIGAITADQPVAAVVAVEHGLVGHRVDAFGQRGALEQAHRVVRVVGLMDLPADDLAAVEVQDQVQVEPETLHAARQEGHVPAPHLAGAGGDVRARWTAPTRWAGPTAALHLAINAVIVLIMSGFILFDTSRIVHGGETNYIRATVGLYLNIFNLFTALLQLLGVFGGDD